MPPPGRLDTSDCRPDSKADIWIISRESWCEYSNRPAGTGTWHLYWLVSNINVAEEIDGVIE